MHDSSGGRTPHYGSMTPAYGEEGSRTPGRSAWDPSVVGAFYDLVKRRSKNKSLQARRHIGRTTTASRHRPLSTQTHRRRSRRLVVDIHPTIRQPMHHHLHRHSPTHTPAPMWARRSKRVRHHQSRRTAVEAPLTPTGCVKTWRWRLVRSLKTRQ